MQLLECCTLTVAHIEMHTHTQKRTNANTRVRSQEQMQTYTQSDAQMRAAQQHPAYAHVPNRLSQLPGPPPSPPLGMCASTTLRWARLAPPHCAGHHTALGTAGCITHAEAY